MKFMLLQSYGPAASGMGAGAKSRSCRGGSVVESPRAYTSIVSPMTNACVPSGRSISHQ